jgi:hypothetical protein
MAAIFIQTGQAPLRSSKALAWIIAGALAKS